MMQNNEIARVWHMRIRFCWCVACRLSPAPPSSSMALFCYMLHFFSLLNRSSGRLPCISVAIRSTNIHSDGYDIWFHNEILSQLHNQTALTLRVPSKVLFFSSRVHILCCHALMTNTNMIYDYICIIYDSMIMVSNSNFPLSLWGTHKQTALAMDCFFVQRIAMQGMS